MWNSSNQDYLKYLDKQDSFCYPKCHVITPEIRTPVNQDTFCLDKGVRIKEAPLHIPYLCTVHLYTVYLPPQTYLQSWESFGGSEEHGKTDTRSDIERCQIPFSLYVNTCHLLTQGFWREGGREGMKGREEGRRGKEGGREGGE